MTRQAHLRSTGKAFPELSQFLLCPTPPAWLEQAPRQLDILLIDHAHCEKKAAATAFQLMFRYTDNLALQNSMSRLAREELRHYEQVLAIMKRRGISYGPLAASGYASQMRAHIRTREPERLIDSLIVGAFIEARSCERFGAMAPLLDKELNAFYTGLRASEARHFQVYLQLAQAAADGESLDDRIALFAEADRCAVTTPDAKFRFHSGASV